MGYTKEMIKARYDVCVGNKNKGGEDFFRPLLDVLNNYPDKVFGYQEFGKDGVVVIGGDLLLEEREKICKCFPNFNVIMFLKGISQDIYEGDPSLVQRVIVYGGSLPGWKWAIGTGEWKAIYQECIKDIEAMKRLGFIRITAQK